MRRSSKRLALALGFAVLVTANPAGAALDPASTESARKGAAYLASLQEDDGSVAGARADLTAEAIIALVAGGGQDDTVARALDFVRAKAPEPFKDDEEPGPRTGRIVMGLVAVGEDPHSFEGVDFVARIEAEHNPVTGGYGGINLYSDTLAMLGLLAADAPLPDAAIRHLRINQCDNGGWGHAFGCTNNQADTDTTPLAMAVLGAALGPDAAEVRKARQWLLDTQNPSGCWGHQAGGVDNTHGCGLIIAALNGLGEDPGAAPWTAGERAPLRALRDLQMASGGFRFNANQSRENAYATVQAVPGLAGWGLPVAPPEPEPDPGGGGGNGGSNGKQGSTTTSTARHGTTARRSTTTTSAGSDGEQAAEVRGARDRLPWSAARRGEQPLDPDILDPGVPGRGATTTADPDARGDGEDGTAVAHLPDEGGGGPPGLLVASALGALGAAAVPTAWWGRRLVLLRRGV